MQYLQPWQKFCNSSQQPYRWYNLEVRIQKVRPIIWRKPSRPIIYLYFEKTISDGHNLSAWILIGQYGNSLEIKKKNDILSYTHILYNNGNNNNIKVLTNARDLLQSTQTRIILRYVRTRVMYTYIYLLYYYCLSIWDVRFHIIIHITHTHTHTACTYAGIYIITATAVDQRKYDPRSMSSINGLI